jgi:hypothetical protein
MTGTAFAMERNEHLPHTLFACPAMSGMFSTLKSHENRKLNLSKVFKIRQQPMPEQRNIIPEARTSQCSRKNDWLVLLKGGRLQAGKGECDGRQGEKG